MAKPAKKILYIGKDEEFFSFLDEKFGKEKVEVDNFAALGLSFTDLPKKKYSVIIVDCTYTEPLTIIETVRTSYKGGQLPYILLAVTADRLKSVKKELTVRNYPDDLCIKDSHRTHLINHILFSFIHAVDEDDTEGVKKDIFKGSLRKTYYGQLLFILYQQEFTGRLVIETPPDRGIFLFFKGEPVSVKFNRLQFTLGRLLLKRGIIDDGMYMDSLEKMLEKDMKHGEVLIEMGIIKPSDLVELIKEQHLEKLMYFFAKTGGSYLGVREDVDINEFMTITYNPFSLIYRGIKECVSADHLAEKYLSCKDRFVAVNEKYTLFRDRIPFTAEEKQFLDQLTEAPKLAELLDSTTLDLTQVLKIFEVMDSCFMFTFEESKENASRLSQWSQPRLIEMKEKITRDYLGMKDKNYYDVMGVRRDAASSDIKKKYLELAKFYHPDRYSHLPLNKEMMGLVSQIFQMVQAAYETLTDEAKRTAYNENLAEPEIDEMMRTSEDIINAEIAFTKGEIVLRRRKYAEAEAYFREAVKLNGKEPEYFVNLGISLLYQKGNNLDVKDKDAQKSMEKAIFLNPYYEKAYYHLGIVYKLRGDGKDAILCFKKALSLNPSNKDAMSELKALETL